ncbi:MAG: hypothetical protein V7767_11300 [Leeuwenhoekiella sp.]
MSRFESKKKVKMALSKKIVIGFFAAGKSFVFKRLNTHNFYKKYDANYLNEKYPATLLQVISNNAHLVNTMVIKEKLKEKEIQDSYLSSTNKSLNVGKLFHVLAFQLSLHAK